MLTRIWAMVTAFVLLIALLSGRSQPADAEVITVRLQPDRVVAGVGDTVLVGVVVEGAFDLGAFEFHLGYDPSVLTATGAELGPFLTSTGRSPVPLGPMVKSGEIRFAGASYGTAGGPGGAGVLAQVRFRVIGSGTSALTFNRVIITDTHAQVLSARTSNGMFTTGERSYPPVHLPLVLR